MCMMIFHPPNAEPFSLSEFVDFHRRNRNGFGIIWREPNGKIKAHRGFYGPDKAYAMYRRLLRKGVEMMALHWRLATAGSVSLENCHPMPVTRGIVLMHNGVLDHRSTASMSDTRCFVADVLKPDLKEIPDLLYDDDWCDAIDDLIGPGNKLILWDRNEPEPVLIGESKGLWWRGRWYSNSYAWTSSVRYGKTKKAGKGDWSRSFA